MQHNYLICLVIILLVFSSCGSVDYSENSSVASIVADSSVSSEESATSQISEDFFYRRDNKLDVVYNSQNKPTYIESALSTEEIKKIVITFSAKFILTNDGKVYSWGYNDTADLGLGVPPATSISTPTQIELPEPIIDLYANPSGVNLFVVGKSGKIYGWGFDHFGIVRKPGGEGVNIPIPVEARFTITDLSYSPTMITVKDDKGNWYGKGKLITQGYDSYMTTEGVFASQLDQDWTQIAIPNNANIVKSITDYNYRAFLSNDGKVFFNGYLESALFHDDITEIIYPEKITDISPLQRGIVSLGESGKLYFIGNDLYSMISDKKIQAIQPHIEPILIDKIKSPVKKLSTSSSGILVLTEHNKLFMWGYNVDKSRGDTLESVVYEMAIISE